MNLLKLLRLWIHRKIGFHNYNLADIEMKCMVCGEKPGIFVRPGDTYTFKEMVEKQ